MNVICVLGIVLGTWRHRKVSGQRSGRRVFQAEGTAGAKALRQDQACWDLVMGRPPWLEGSDSGESEKDKVGGSQTTEASWTQ